MLLTIFCMVCTAHRQCSGLVLATDSIIDGRESQILAELCMVWVDGSYYGYAKSLLVVCVFNHKWCHSGQHSCVTGCLCSWCQPPAYQSLDLIPSPWSWST